MTSVRRAAIAAACALVLGVAAMLAQAPAERKIMVYAPEATFPLPVLERETQEYVELFALIEPLGGSLRVLDGTYRATVRGAEGEFEHGHTRTKVRGARLELPVPVRVENGRALLPVRGLAQLLARWTDEPVDFRESSGRLFLRLTPTIFSAEMRTGERPSLVLSFSARVNPVVNSEPGRVRLSFRREPLVGPAAAQSFDDKTITALAYSEPAAIPEIAVSASAPLQVTFAEGNRKIVLTPLLPAAVPQAPPEQPTATSPPPEAPAAPAQAASPPPTRPTGARFLVVIDPAHGGDDNGVKFHESAPEKNLTLAIARRLRQELQSAGISAVLLRDSDESISAGQRAVTVNSLRPNLYIALHAGTSMRAMRIFTSLSSETAPPRSAFVRWQDAQARYLEQSRSAAQLLANQVSRREMPAVRLGAALPPMAQVAAPAIAVELAPADGRLETLQSNAYQAAVTSALAGAVADLRKREAQ